MLIFDGGLCYTAGIIFLSMYKLLVICINDVFFDANVPSFLLTLMFIELLYFYGKLF